MIELCLLAAGMITGENRARIGEVEVVGPVRDVELSLGQGGDSRIEGELLDGERQRLRVPFAARGTGRPTVVPRIRWESADSSDANGTARFLGWSAEESLLDRLPPGILSRPRPPVGPGEVALPLAALGLLPAAFLLALFTRERRATSILVSLAGAALVLGFSSRGRDRAAAGATVLECDEGSDLALEIRASFATGSLDAAELPSTALEVDPEGAQVVWIGSFQPGSPWRARSPGSALYFLRTYEPGERRISSEGNLALPLAQSWVRREGEWTARGAWPLGSPVPDPRSGPPPPGWLSSGLPQGVSVLLGRVEPGAGARGEAWIRVTGFR